MHYTEWACHTRPGSFPLKWELQSIKGNELRVPQLLFISSSAGVVLSAPNAAGKVDEREALSDSEQEKTGEYKRCVQGLSLKLQAKKYKEHNHNKTMTFGKRLPV